MKYCNNWYAWACDRVRACNHRQRGVAQTRNALERRRHANIKKCHVDIIRLFFLFFIKLYKWSDILHISKFIIIFKKYECLQKTWMLNTNHIIWEIIRSCVKMKYLILKFWDEFCLSIYIAVDELNKIYAYFTKMICMKNNLLFMFSILRGSTESTL